MASNTQGIQQLLAAEKIAADKVGDARKREFQSYFFTQNISRFCVPYTQKNNHVSTFNYTTIGHMTNICTPYLHGILFWWNSNSGEFELILNGFE